MAPLSNIPTNVITGFLGAGKSTAILNLLSQKPDGETWAVLVNEFGEVGVDGSLIEGSVDAPGVVIREVPGGCMCCTAGLPMQMAMNMLLARAKPARLLIEPTGLGHPAEVLTVLRASHYQDVLDLKATITLVDARKLADDRYTRHEIFNQQLDIADVVIASKADLYGGDEAACLVNYLAGRGLWTPVLPAPNGALPLDILAEPAARQLPEVTTLAAPQSQDTEDKPFVFPPEGYVRLANRTAGFAAHGWLFSQDFVFDRDALEALMKATAAERIKAVVRTVDGNVGFNGTGEGLEVMTLRDLEDSRIEVIAGDDFPAEVFEAGLLKTASRNAPVG